MTHTVDPRVTRTRGLVIQAAAEILGERGIARTTIEAVAERSGVARSTIYRHWPDRSDLILEAIEHRGLNLSARRTGDLDADLADFFEQIGTWLATKEECGRFLATLAEARRDPQISAIQRKIAERRRRGAVELVEAGIEAGSLPSGTDAEQLVEDLTAPLFYRALVVRKPMDQDEIVAHVARWLGMYRTQNL